MPIKNHPAFAALGALALLVNGPAHSQPLDQDFQAVLAQRTEKLAELLSQEAAQASNAAGRIGIDPTAQLPSFFTFRGARGLMEPSPADIKAATDAMSDQIVSALLTERIATYGNYASYLQDLAAEIRKSATPEQAASLLDAAFLPPAVQEIIHDRIYDPFEFARPPADPAEPSPFSLPPNPSSLGGHGGTTSLTPFILGLGGVGTVDFPSVAALLYDRAGIGSMPYCTATLIAPNAVLTAAHCFCDLEGKGAANHRTAASCAQGTYFRGTTQTRALDPVGHAVFFQHAGRFEIERVLIHEGYDWPVADLAVLILKEPVTAVEPAQLNRIAAVPAGTRAYVTGFGVHGPLDEEGNPRPGGPIIGTQGLKFYAQIVTSPCDGPQSGQRLVCWIFQESLVSEALGSTCRGDSGGPLFVQAQDEWYLAGVTSGGATCLPGDRPFDVEVFHYASWIQERLSQHPPPQAATLPSQRLAPVRNAGRYPLSVLYRRFFNSPDSWTKSFTLPEDGRLLRVAVNGTPHDAFLRLELSHAGNPGLGCATGGDDAVYWCDIPNPAAGQWQFTVRGSLPQEFQVVATVF